MKINYTFANGETSDVEVNEEIGNLVLDSRREESNQDRKERYHCYSLDAAVYEGRDYADGETRKFDFEGLEETLDRLKGKPVYFTLDLDVLDPSVFPGTGTPEPGGVSFEELRKAAELVCRKADVAACDVNELSPPYDPSGISTAAACKIVREMLIALQKKGE